MCTHQPLCLEHLFHCLPTQISDQSQQLNAFSYADDLLNTSVTLNEAWSETASKRTPGRGNIHVFTHQPSACCRDVSRCHCASRPGFQSVFVHVGLVVSWCCWLTSSSLCLRRLTELMLWNKLFALGVLHGGPVPCLPQHHITAKKSKTQHFVLL